MQNPIHSRGIRSLGRIVVGALALAVVGGLALTHVAVPDAVMWGWHDGMRSGGHMAGWGWGMVLFGLVWMALLVALPIYLVVRLATRTGGTDRTDDGALAVLQERYARGEIGDEEFERRRARLTADGGRH